MTHGLRLTECGDLLTVEQYAAWAQQTVRATYNQVHRGSCLVPPFAIKPKPRWRRTDCEAILDRRDLAAQQRKTRLQRRLARAS